MKKFLLATAATALTSGAAFAASHGMEAKIGVLLSFTGPLESITPAMGASAELAFAEINDSGKFLDGVTIAPIRGDATCIDAGAATASAERLITTDGVVAIMGADCSGVTGAVLANVALPNGIPMISPSATSPALSTAEDNDLFFRTAPSDARQGEVLASVLQERGVKSVAVTYTNNDYGKGLADAFAASFEALGGVVTLSSSHEDGKADYSAEVGALASAGGEVLAVFGYTDQGGKGVLQASLDSGAFDTFLLGDGMYGDTTLSMGVEGSYGVLPSAQGEGTELFAEIAAAAGINDESPYTRESYDAGALLALAMAKGGEVSSAAVAANILSVANAPGELIYPGQLGKALEILASGGEIDYVGASNVELIGPGEAAGTYRYYEVKDGGFETVDFR